MKNLTPLGVIVASLVGFAIPAHSDNSDCDRTGGHSHDPVGSFDSVAKNDARMVVEGRKIFRFDTFGDETFWGDQLQLHLAIKGTNFGGVGPGISPRTALELGLK